MCWLITLLSCALANAEEHQTEGIKRTFIDMEKVARLPDEDQKKEVLRVYTDIYLTTAAHIPLLGPLPVENPEALTPEQLADQLERAGSFWLYARADAICKEILHKHQDALRPTIENGLTSRNTKSVHKALSFICDFKPDGFFDAAVKLFNEDEEMPSHAAIALRAIDDPRAIPILVNRNRNRPTFSLSHFESLRRLQRNRPPDMDLLELLSSRDEVIRWRAAYALANCGDVVLAPYVKRLLEDQSPKVRSAAASMGFCLKEPGYSQVRPHLVKLLSDPDTTVRLKAAVAFAERKDKISAHTLLELMKDESIGERTHSNVYQAINNLTGTYFGYYHGSDGWKPSTAVNKAATERFAKWIEDNAKGQPREP